MVSIFKNAAEPPAIQLRTVTTLCLKAGILPHIFRASDPRGHVIALDTGKPLWQRALALAHIPQVYALMSKNRV